MVGMLNGLFAGMPVFSFRHWQAWSIWLVILLFPIFAAGAKGGASYPFAWLVLIGLIYGWGFWPKLLVWERRLFAGFGVLFVVVLVSFLLGDEMREGARRLEKFATFGFVVPAYLAVRRYVCEPGRPFLAGLVLSPFGALAFGLDWDFSRAFATLTLQERLDGFYATIILGNITGLMTLLLLVGVITFAKRWSLLLGGMVFVLLGLLVVLAAASRNGLLFIPIGMMLVFGLLHRYVSRSHGIVFGTVLLALVGMVTLIPDNVVSARVNTAIAHLVDADSGGDFSVGARIDMWRDSLTMWREAPVFGVGLGDFERETKRLIAEGRSGSTVVFGHAHNIYFDALATTGAMGLAAILWFAFWRPFRIGWVAWRAAMTPWQSFYATGVILTVVGFMVFGLTEAWFSRNPMVRTYLMCLLIMVVGLAGKQIPVESVSRHGPDTVK